MRRSGALVRACTPVATPAGVTVPSGGGGTSPRPRGGRRAGAPAARRPGGERGGEGGEGGGRAAAPCPPLAPWDGPWPPSLSPFVSGAPPLGYTRAVRVAERPWAPGATRSAAGGSVWRLGGWRTHTGGGGDRMRGASRGGRWMWTSDGGGGESGALGGRRGALGSGSGANERLRRGGSVGSVSVGGGCAVWGGGGSAAVCETCLRCRARLASEEASAGRGGPCVVPPGTVGRGGEVPHPPLIRRVGVRRRRRLVVRVE